MLLFAAPGIIVFFALNPVAGTQEYIVCGVPDFHLPLCRRVPLADQTADSCGGFRVYQTITAAIFLLLIYYTINMQNRK